jgi:ATP-dependent protease Clp ATPase subunit
MDDLKCNFCDRTRRAVRKFISGPRVFICDGCVRSFIELATTGTPMARVPPVAVALVEGGANAARAARPCSFCGKQPHETRFSYLRNDEPVGKLAVCNECIGLCVDILAEDVGGEWKERVDTWPSVAPAQYPKPPA